MLNKSKNIKCFCTILIFLAMSLCIIKTAKAEDTEKIIRVAYYPLEGFFEYDHNGNETGYGVELLDKISQYSGIKFEYIKADSWESTKEMLLNGEADLRMPATKPTSPSATLSYSNISILSTYNVMLCLDERDDLFYDDYDDIKKIKIAISESFYNANSVQDYFDSIGVKKEQIVFCDGYNECQKKLESGEVDALVSNVMDMNERTKMISRFGNSYNYFSMLLDNKMIALLDNALTEIQLDEPEYFLNSYEKWYPERVKTPFTNEEQIYLNSIKTLTFAFRENEGYLSRYENGEFYGIYVEIAREICNNLGVNFKAVSAEKCQTGEEKADVFAGFFYDKNYAKEFNYCISSPIDNINYYIISKKETKVNTDKCKIAAIEKFKYTKDYIETFYPNADIVYFNSYEKCINAVENGTVDMTIFNNYIAEYYLDMYQYLDLSGSLSSDYSHLVCFAAADNNNIVASLISKGQQKITDEEMKELYIRGQEKKPVSNYFKAILYQNPFKFAFGMASIALLIIVLVFLFAYGQRRKEQNRKLQQALAAKRDFLARMSHDMRTPMNGILGTTTLLLEHEMSDTVREGLIQIKLSGEYLHELINDTLDVSKIESNHLELHPLPGNSLKVIENVVANAKTISEEKGVNFEFIKDVNEEVKPLLLYFDSSRVEQIFMNLISNAIKFTPKDGNVCFKMKRLETNEQYILTYFAISDTGIGMKPEFIQNIYEPFAQEQRNICDNDAGTGLGLSIVKELVDLMQGKIELQSEENVGTTFRVTLRFERYQGDALNSEENDTYDESVLEGKRVLLCEDHPINRKIAEQLLIKKGINVEIAENGLIGINKFKESDIGYYDLILMDLRMPELNGYEATEVIRGFKRKDSRKIPIIAMTANAFDEDIDKCLAIGMNAHLSKPIDVKEMYQTIAKFLE